MAIVNYDEVRFIGDPEDGCEFYPNLYMDHHFGPIMRADKEIAQATKVINHTFTVNVESD